MVMGLRSDKASIFNGMSGEVFDFDEEHHRWAVQLQDGELKEFKT